MKDLIIIGNGMAGMTAALYAKRANLDFTLVGFDEYEYGQIANAILVENYPCAASQSGFDLADSLHDQLLANNISIEQHTVKEIKIESDGTFRVITEDEWVGAAKSIIYACGCKHRELPAKIDQGTPIHYCAICDGPLYKDKRAAVIGGGDVAFTQAEYLSKICKDVYIVMCDQNVTAASATFDRVSKLHNVHIWYDAPVTSISKDNEGVCCILCKGVRSPLFAEGIFVAIGMIPNTEPLRDNCLELLSKQGYVMATENGDTTIPGFFAAGDVRCKMLRQALTAASDGANCANSVVECLKRS